MKTAIRILAITTSLLSTLAVSHAQFTAGDLAVFSADNASANNTTFTILELSSSTASQSSPINSISINGTAGSSALRTSGSAGTTGCLSDSDDGTLVIFTGHNTITTSGNINTILPRGVGTLNASGTFNLATTYTGTSGNQTRGACSLDNNLWYIGDQGGIYTNGTSSALNTNNIRGVRSFGGTIYVVSAKASTVVSTLSGNGKTLTGLSGLASDSSAVDFYIISSGQNGTTFDVLYVLDETSATAGTIKKYSLVSGSWTANGTYSTSFGGDGICAAISGSGAVLYMTTGDGVTAANSVIKLTDTTGWNTTINITTASNVTLYTAAAGTVMKGIAFAPVAACTTPTAYGVTGGGSYCSGGSGVAVGLANSQTGVNYQLFRNGGATAVGSYVAGIGGAISFGNQTVADTYTVVATNTTGGCTANMTGSATVTVNPIPSSTITAATTVCPGSTGNPASVPDADGGASYGWTISGGSITAGSGTASITYTANASGSINLGCTVTNSSGCYSNASSATVSISAAVTTTAGNDGPYCVGQTISLSATGGAGDTYSWTGPNNFTSSLQNPTIANATAVNAGDYTVTRTTACGTSPGSTTTVVVNAIPNSSITAAGSVCGNSTGNTASVPDAGGGASYGWTITGGSITAGNSTASVTYTANANGSINLGCTVTNSSGCYSNASSASVTINPLPGSVITAANSTYVNSTNNSASVPDAGVGATYNWTISGGTITAGSTTNSITYTAGVSGMLTLGCTVTNSSGCYNAGSANVTVHPAFTTRNLAVLRLGDGSVALTSAGTPVFVDEYTTAGTLVQSVALPTNAIGANNPLTASGSAATEGQMTRSSNSNYLCVVGYNTTVGTASVKNTASRTTARIDAGGDIDSSTTGTPGGTADNARSCASSDGTGFWTSHATQGLFYEAYDGLSMTKISPANTRAISIVNGNLYYATSSGSAGIYGFSGLPTTAQTTNIVLATGGTPNGFAFNPGGTIAYIADSVAGISKWTNNGASWSLAYTFNNAAATASSGLTVDWTGSNPIVYATTTNASANALIAIVDTGAGSTFATLAAAPANTVFRGVAFTPESAPIVTAQPQVQTNCSGSTATFNSSGDGAATLTTQWQVSTNNGTTWNNIDGATLTTYAPTVTTADNAKQYRAVFSNTYGTATSAAATLTVYAVPAITTGPTSETIYAGGEADFTVIATGDSLNYQWRKNGVTLTTDSHITNVTLPTLTINPASTNDAALAVTGYDCVISSGVACGSVTSAPVALTVLEPALLTINSSVVNLTFYGTPGSQYDIQRATDLTSPSWVTIETTNAPATGEFQFTDNFSDLGGPAYAPVLAFYRLHPSP